MDKDEHACNWHSDMRIDGSADVIGHHELCCGCVLQLLVCFPPVIPTASVHPALEGNWPLCSTNHATFFYLLSFLCLLLPSRPSRLARLLTTTHISLNNTRVLTPTDSASCLVWAPHRQTLARAAKARIRLSKTAMTRTRKLAIFRPTGSSSPPMFSALSSRLEWLATRRLGRPV